MPLGTLTQIQRIPWKRRVALELFRGYRFLQTRFPELRYLFWESTLRCNLDCMHCGSDCLREAVTPDMPKEDFFRVLDGIQEKVDPARTLIVITGGEPLMRSDLEECGREFQKRGHPWGMVTNGYAMTPARFQGLLDSGLCSLTVSLDGLEQSHDHFRGRAQSFRRAMQTIRMALATPGLTFDVVTCVNQQNLAELPHLRDEFIAMGLKRWRIATVFAKGRAKQHDILFLNDAQFAQVFAFIRETRLQGKILASYSCEGYLGALEGEVRDAPFFCRAGTSIGSVLVDGSISACPSLRADFIQGNIYRDEFWDVWTRRFQKMRDRSWARTGKCAECKDWKYCHGNGLHLRDEKTGELLLCHLERLTQ
jgi:radical SAM enzyme (rSAM/lipoprotein system)